ncbi:MAG TPA: hypothetical protein VMZ30_11260 [Pyrinomonadaceae bacterium]|nr:hypothetical protein [Pyrinomonadaceae bacterium]
MIHHCHRETVNVFRLGSLDTSEVEQALHHANALQHAFNFKFDFYGQRLSLDEKYKLHNGGYDLCGAVEELLKTNEHERLPRPLIVLSAEPLGDPDHASDPDWFYLSSQEEEYDPQVTIISTQPLAVLPKTRSLENYLFMMLSIYMLTTYANVSYHDNSIGCVLDYCDELSALENCFIKGELCNDCEVQLQQRMRQNQISIEKVAAATRMLNRAAGRKYCFVVMPFKNRFNPVFEVICEALLELGWKIRRADEVSYPRIITDLILKEILTSDLVVADLTNSNPNVFYEVGLTHTVGNDLLLLTQQKQIPFDLKNEQTIFYGINELEKLKKAIQLRVGSGVA